MDKLKMRVVHPETGEVITSGEFFEVAKENGWSEDPGTGRAVLLLDSRGNPAYEVGNPMPFAPPIGWEPTPPLDQLIRDRVRDEFQRLKGEEEIDDINDANNFDIPDELPPLETIFELMGMEEQAPAVEKEPSEADRALAEANYQELVDMERLKIRRNRKAALEKQRAEEDALYGIVRPRPGLVPPEEGEGA